MKRKNLYRGKSVHDGKWDYGYLATPNVIVFEHDPCDIEDLHNHMSIVDPTAVGQYTNLTDKHGTKIFEGDIVKFPNGRIRWVFWGISSFRHTAYGEHARDLDNN